MDSLINVAQGVWIAITHHRMGGVLLSNNNLFLVKTVDASGKACLVASNVPNAQKSLIDQVKALEKEEAAPLRFILGSDFHHLFIQQWCKAFPGTAVYFPSGRAPRLHAGEGLELFALDRETPEIPAQITLVPFRGFGPAPMLETTAEEKERAEFSVYDPASKSLFFFDVLIPNMPQLGALSTMLWGKPTRSIWVNFKGWGGFRLEDNAKAQRSAKHLLDLDVEHICFSHGVADDIVNGKEECREFMETYFKTLAETGSV